MEIAGAPAIVIGPRREGTRFTPASAQIAPGPANQEVSAAALLTGARLPEGGSGREPGLTW